MAANKTAAEVLATPATACYQNTSATNYIASAAERKRFATLAARFALAGFGLIRNDPAPGLAPYCAARWGWIRPLHSLDDAERFLKQIGGRHGI